jgi:phosphonate transport system substrate-binding protein
MKLSISILILIIFASCIGCKNGSDLDAVGIPNKLVIAVYQGSGDNSGSVKKGLEPFRVYLEKKLDKKVTLILTTDYTSVIEAIRSKKAHIAYLSPFSYVLASQKHDIVPMVAIGENGQPSIYRSVIFTGRNTGIKNIDDLKAKAKTLSLCFSDPASTSGHLIPRAYLNTIGLNTDNAFKQTLFAGSHAASVLSVASGKVDIGCSTIEYGLNILERRGMVHDGDLIKLWISDPIVASPIVIRADINKEYATKIKDIYLNLSSDAPDVFSAYIKLYHTNPEKLSYLPIDDSLYNGIRKIASGIKDLNVLN